MTVSMGGYSTWQCPSCQRVSQRAPLPTETVLHCQAPAADSAPFEQLCGRRLVRVNIVTMYGQTFDGGPSPDVLTR